MKKKQYIWLFQVLNQINIKKLYPNNDLIYNIIIQWFLFHFLLTQTIILLFYKIIISLLCIFLSQVQNLWNRILEQFGSGERARSVNRSHHLLGHDHVNLAVPEEPCLNFRSNKNKRKHELCYIYIFQRVNRSIVKLPPRSITFY